MYYGKLARVTLEDESILTSMRVVRAVSKFGHCNPVQARIFVGDLGWKVIEELGGWGNLCRLLTERNTPSYLHKISILCRTLAKNPTLSQRFS